MFKITIKTLKTTLLLLIIILTSSCGEDPAEPTNGVDGANGFNALVEVQNVEAGDNCPTGGVKISVGQDQNGNGKLDDSEISSVSFVCTGASGENGQILVARTSPENPGENCEQGGTLVEIGADLNTNNSLDNDEVQTSFFVCNGADGSNGGGDGGLTSLIRTTPLEDCGGNSVAGIRIEVGLDSNGNGQLDDDPNEIQSTYELCNGIDGSDGVNTLLFCTNEPNGANCSSGGIKMEVGLDSNGNGSLDDEEKVGEPKFVCNGINGSDGKSPIVTTTTDVSCANGGVELTFGYDNDSNGTIDEVLETITICNGADGTDGLNSIIQTSASSTCTNGGTLVEVGTDSNRNGMLDSGEIDSSFDVCNGSDGNTGLNSVVDISTFSGNAGSCNTNDGGIIIRVGIDDNGNGSLDIPAEVDQTQYICNGDDGTDGSDGNSDGIFEFYFQEGFDAYTGVSDVAISDKLGTENAVSFSVDRKSEGDFHGLLHFPEIDTRVSEGVGTTEFEIVEAILYLRGQSRRIDGVSTDNFIGVKTLLPEAPLFDETRVSWTAANSSEDWVLSGVADNTTDVHTYSYSDMFRLPYNITFEGYIPLLLNRDEIKQWTLDKGSNKGLVLLMVDDFVQYELDIISSEDTKNTSHRPLLYIKVKAGVKNARTVDNTEKNYQLEWRSKSYGEKLAPLYRRSSN